MCNYVAAAAPAAATPQTQQPVWTPDPNSNISTTEPPPAYLIQACADATAYNVSFASDVSECDVFYSCAGSIRKFRCAVGTVWTPSKESCQLPHEAVNPVCGLVQSVIPAPPAAGGGNWEGGYSPPPPDVDANTPSTEAPHPYAVKQCGSLQVLFTADPSNCQNFYQCNNGIPVKLKCAQGSIWTPSTNQCTLPALASNSVCGYSYDGGIYLGPQDSDDGGDAVWNNPVFPRQRETTTPDVLAACAQLRAKVRHASAAARKHVDQICNVEAANTRSKTRSHSSAMTPRVLHSVLSLVYILLINEILVRI